MTLGTSRRSRFAAVATLVAVLAVVLGHGAAIAASPARLDQLDREHLLMLMGSGLETWRLADAEILIGAVPWFIEMFVTVPEDIVVRASRVEARGGAAVVTLRGGDEKRLEELFAQLVREGWTRRALIDFGAGGNAARIVADAVFCRADASIVVWKAPRTAEGLDLKITYRNNSLGCRGQEQSAIERQSSLAESAFAGSVFEDPAVRALLEVAVPSGGGLGPTFGAANDTWGEVFSLAHTPASVEETLGHYERELRSRGWRVSSRHARPGMAFAVFESIGDEPRRGGVLTISEDVAARDRKNLAFRFDRAAALGP